MKKESIKEFFDCDAHDFVTKRWSYEPEGYADYKDTLDFISQSLHKRHIRYGFSCLELGAGTGFWFNALKQLGCTKYHAIDISDEMLSLNPAEKHFCFDLNKGLPSELNEKYDLVLSVHSLEYIEDPLQLIGATTKHLDTDGVILIVTKNKKAYAWRLFKFVADKIAGTQLNQRWIGEHYFDVLNMKTECYGINCRIPTMFNNVNASFPFKHSGGEIRRFISNHINPRLSHSTSSPFSWHIGFILSFP